ncbi:growth-regulated alpha protein-like isoform X1 [Conger conger]|uniref:growth-regulated alpha protein-like isoform X1 n=1 Tax=Conger conger TaxID=82655 RepID=UPI002A59AF0F|nr:growth-regulated alpha protein-like isoform X1 [Conger conger]
MIARLLLVLALIASLASAAPEQSRGQCKCFRTRSGFGPTWAIQDMQIYPPSQFCGKMEIVVHLKNGVQYCLDPKAKKVQEMVQKLQNSNSAPTVSPEDGSPDLWASV